jgi:FtsZ-binding cell division protein ZapB
MNKMLIFNMLIFCVTISIAQGDSQQVRSKLEKWIEVRSLMSREKEEWRVGREVLQNRIALVETELESLQAKTAACEKEITEADARRADLVEENESLKRAAGGLQTALPDMEQRLLELLRVLPEPIQERVRPLSQRIPKEKESKLSLSERFQNVVGVLNELNKFSREITVTSEVRDLQDGTRAEVQVLYAGLAQAWYSSNNGTLAGVGRPGADGWVWQENNRMASEVLEAIAMYRNEKAAAYRELSIQITDNP